MSCLYYHDHELYIEDVPLHSIVATYGTPCYVYSRARLESNWRMYEEAFSSHPHLICYAVKANSNLGILNILSEMNSGFDIVSGGELTRVLAAGGKPKKIIFSGVGKKQSEIEDAIQRNIYCFNVESELEIERIAGCAILFNKQVNVAIRINPNIDPETHEHISTGLVENKFGIDIEDVLSLAKRIKNHTHINLIGIACHIGSQITSTEPFIAMLDYLAALYGQLEQQQTTIQLINVGGGLGIVYQYEKPPTIGEYVDLVLQKLGQLPVTIVVEPGRSIVGSAGVLLTRVEYIKQSKAKNFAVVDAGMNDLIRPALYGSWQHVLCVKERTDVQPNIYDVVGPLCESADFLAKDRELAITPLDILAIDKVGAYGFSMSSNYNSRGRACEVLVDETETLLIRRRETIDDLLVAEKIFYRNLVT